LSIVNLSRAHDMSGLVAHNLSGLNRRWETTNETDNMATRFTNGFSKKIENHYFATALYFMYYNFGRIHKTLRVTPAMEAGVSDHIWSLEEIAGLV
jgi:hypothetical protein